MLVFKAKNVLGITPVVEKPYDFNDDDGKQVKGVSIKGTVTVIGSDDKVAVITVKGKTLAEAQAKMDGLKVKVGQPAEIAISPAVVGGVAQLKI